MNRNPLDIMLTYIGDLLKFLEEHKGSISQNLTPEVYKQLEQLEKVIDSFDEMNRNALKTAHINIHALSESTLHSSQVEPKDKALLERAKRIERDARELKLQYSLAINRASKNSDKEKRRERRKKFKNFGNDRGWIPL